MNPNPVPENLTRPIVRKTKTATSFFKNMQHPFRGGKVNYLGEPSFRAWIAAGVPFYLLAARKHLPLWRWLLIVVPHLLLLDAEANNTAHEESIRSHRKQTWHFRNAMDSASFSVLLRVLAVLVCVLYALFGPDPWGLDVTQSPDAALESLVHERHVLTAELSTKITHRRRRFIWRRLKDINRLEPILTQAVYISDLETRPED